MTERLRARHPAPEAPVDVRHGGGQERLGRLPRLVIEGVAPQLECGRYPVKRIVGDELRVEADIFKEGHDRLAARVLYRRPAEKGWREAPMAYDPDEDRWSGSLALDTIGRWEYTVLAWTDVFGSWRSEFERWLEAGKEIAVHLLEGARIVERAAGRARGAEGRALAEAAGRLADPRSPVGERTRLALSRELEALARAHLGRGVTTRFERVLPLQVDRERARFAAWYEMFPRSYAARPGRHGTFADAERRLPQLARLGFDVIYLPPIHPIGRTHRKGRNNRLVAGAGDPGSPWAIGGAEGGHTAVHPELGTLEDFDRFVRSAEALGMEVALDYALQCSPDHPWVREHPEWFFVRPDGTIQFAQNPPKTYEDIVPLDFWCEDRDALWAACRDVLMFWVGRGVRTFRVDNPHTKPFAFWEWVITEVQREHPDVVFLSEAFTRPKRMRRLAKLGFTQSYTYFTWRNAPAELAEYLTELTATEMAEYFRGNLFANTPDILHAYLQEGGPPAFRARLLLAGTLSPLYGVYSGFELCEREPREPGSEEYLDSEKYQIRQRDWDAPGNLNEDLMRLNRIRRENRALQLHDNLRFHPSENDAILFFVRTAPGNDLLVAVNLDPRRVQETMVHVPLEELALVTNEPFEVEDLLSGERYLWRGSRNYVKLDPTKEPGHVLRVVRRPTTAPGTASRDGRRPA